MICKYCNKEMRDKFRVHKVINGKAYYRKKCNECYYLDAAAYRNNSRKQIDKIKSKKKCAACGFDDWRALQHHHREGEEKLFEIGNAVNRGYSMEAIKKEMEKCQALCANCHQILHHKERRLKIL